MAKNSDRQRTHADYNIACICPMDVELAPVEGMLDEIHEPLHINHQRNAYTLGSIGGHNIVIAIMPEVGNNAAAVTLERLRNDFPVIRFGLLVGVGGGVPIATDIRLGDVVVGQPTDTSPGVVQYDMGKELAGGKFQRTGYLNKPPEVLRASIRKLNSQHRRLGYNLSLLITEMLEKYPVMHTQYSFPTKTTGDQLFSASYEHRSGPNCDQCDAQYLIPRLARPDLDPRIHYGTIGSANKLIKDAGQRDKIWNDTHALCVEMEAAGLMGDFPCLVIRGICDYADSHKNKEWQPYAAAVAAAYMKALLMIVPSQKASSESGTIETTTSPFNLGVQLLEAPDIETDLFVGRSAELQKMDNILRLQNLLREHRRLVLGGFGGVGKTQLAITYAKRHADSFDSVFWLNATSEISLKHSIRQMAQRVLDVEKYLGLDDDQILLYTTRWLSDIKNPRWLLIFDNYDEPDTYDIGNYSSHSAHGCSIITTRVPEMVRGQQLLIRPLTDIDQGIKILSRRSKRTEVNNDTYAVDLVKRMQGLPLALATVGAYLRHSPWTFQEYLQIYEKQFNVDNHRAFHLPEYQDRTLHTTWDITYVRLEADYPESARLLRSFAFFDNQHLHYDLFRIRNDHGRGQKRAKMISIFRSLVPNQTDKHLSEPLSRMSRSEFESAMHVLTEYCFVEVRSARRDYSIHSCVHDWALSSQNALAQKSGYWFAFDRVADLVSAIEEGCYAHTKYRDITYHAVRLVHVSFRAIIQMVSVKRLKSMRDIARFLGEQIQLDAAEQMFIQALTVYEKSLGLQHISTLDTVNGLGSLYMEQGRLTEAEQMYNRVLVGYEKVLGPEHTSTVTAVHYLGILYNKQGKLAEAEQMYNQALVRYEKVLGLQHTSTLTTVHNLGYLYMEQGKLVEAEQMYNQALVRYEKVFGLEHTSTLTAVHNLGILYDKQGKLVEAEEMYDRALAGYERILGSEHTTTLTAVNNLGLLYLKQGKLAKAEEIFDRVLAEYEKVLGSQHTSTLTAIHNLGLLHLKQGKLVEAEQIYNRALAGYERVLGLEHTSTLNTVYCLGVLYKEQGKLVEAKKMFQRAVTGRQEALGSNHPDTKAVLDSFKEIELAMSGNEN